MPQFYDPQRALTEDWRTFFIERPDEEFTFPCVEGEVVLNGRWALLNVMLCMPLINRHRPISRDKHMMLSGIYGAKAHAARLTEITKSLEEYGYDRKTLGHDTITTVMDAHNMCYTHLGSYIRTMDIFAIADTILQPGVKEICTPDYGDITDGNINRMEAAFKKQSMEVDDVLSGKTDIDMKYNIFKAPLVCGALKNKQFYQFVLSAGPRTDTDESIFLRPVVGSFLAGMKDIQDLAIESRSAAKAKHYNNSQMSSTQYNNRKIHIQNSVMWHLYPGDCGSDVYATYTPSAPHVHLYQGKFFVGPSGELLELTPERYDMVVEKETKFRDVPECRYTDGYCEVCGGTITKSFSKDVNVGFLSNVNTGAPVAQQVLSTKHLISTDAAEYDVPDALSRFLMSITNDIFLRPPQRKHIATYALGFKPADMARLNDLMYFVDENFFQASAYTDIKYMHIGRVDEEGNITERSTGIPMKSSTKTYPHLSPDVLSVIRRHPEDIVAKDGLVWLYLRNINPDAPVLQCAVVNNSIKGFVDKFSNLVSSDVSRFTSINDLMRELMTLVWDKVDVHVTHLSCLARSCAITSRKDFHIPIITDPDNVLFSTLNRIIPMRSIGGLFAFEGFSQISNKPITYITAKKDGIFDKFMGYTDDIELNMNWPVTTGDPIRVE